MGETQTKITKVSNTQEVFIGQENVLVVRLTDMENNPIANASITGTATIKNQQGATISKSLIKTKTNASGKITISDSSDIENSYCDISLKYAGDSTYASSTYSATYTWISDNSPINTSFQLTMLEENITVGQTSHLSLILTDNHNQPLPQESITGLAYIRNSDGTLIRKDTIQRKTNENGEINLEYTSDVVSSCEITLNYNGRDRYTATSYSTTINWSSKKETTIIISANDVYYPNKPLINGILKETSTDKGIADANVKLLISDEVIDEGITGSNGKITFVNSQTPKKYPIKTDYALQFMGSEEYYGSIAYITAGYYKNQTKLIEVSNTNEVYVGDENEIVIEFRNNEGISSPNRTVRYTLVLKDNDGNEIDTVEGSGVTNSEGRIAVTYTSNEVGTGTVEWKYNGSASHDVSTLTSTCIWKPKDTISITGKRTNVGTPQYDTPITIKGTWKNETNPNDDVSGREIILVRNDVEVESKTTDNKGVVTFSDVPTPNSPWNTEDKYKYYLRYRGDDERQPITQYISSVRYVNPSKLIITPSVTTSKVKKETTITVELRNNVGVLGNQTIHMDVFGKRSNGVVCNYDTENISFEKTTNSNGIATFKFITDIAGIYEFTFIFAGTNVIEWCMDSINIEYTKIPTKLEIVSEPEGYLKVFDIGRVVVELRDSDTDELLTNVPVTKSISFKSLDGEDISEFNIKNSEKEVLTDNKGQVSLEYQATTLGDIVGTFRFNRKNDDAYLLSKVNTNVRWEKIPTDLERVGSVLETSVTLRGYVRVMLKELVGETALNNKNVDIVLGFTTFNGDEVNVTGLSDIRNKITNDNGMVTGGYIPTNIGDIQGRINFIFKGDNIYKQTSSAFTIRWNKIETQISSSDVTIYNGRYTNIFGKENEIDWTVESEGVNPNYKNFHAKLEKVEDENYPTPATFQDNSKINFDYTNVTLFSATIDENGNAYARWSKTYDSLPRNYTFNVKYNGDDLFKPAQKDIHVKVLARIQPVLKPYFETKPGNGDPFRYKVPFYIRAKLTENTENGTPMANQYILLTYVETSYDTFKTNNNGIATRIHTAYSVGEKNVKFEFDKEDKIDKYLPVTANATINIDKERLILTINTISTVYTDCNSAEFKLKLTDSLERPLENNKVYFLYDDGTYDTQKWFEFEDKYVTTNADGEATYHADPYSGLRIIKGTTLETTNYYSAEGVGKVEYDISKEYFEDVSNGLVEIPVECILNPSNGLPEGLYDVKLEYIPPITDNGQCKEYGLSTNFQPIRKKKGTILMKMTEELTTQTYIPLFIETVLFNYKQETLSGFEEISKVNGKNEMTHITDANGYVIRGRYGTTANESLNYYFQSEETRIYAGSVLEVEGRTTKIQPVLEVTSPIEGYSRVPMTLEATLYYERKKYDDNHYEVKKYTIDNEDYELYHDGINNTYYRIDSNGTKTNIDKIYYDTAESIVTKIPLANKTVVWRGIGGSTELVRATTDKDGYATAQYGKTSVGEVTIYATTDEDKDYFGCRVGISVTTNERITPYFKDIDFSQDHAVYKHSRKIFTYLYYDKKDNNGNKIQTPFSNQTVVFKKSGVELGSRITNEDGYVEMDYVPTSELKDSYQVVFRGYDQYDKTDTVYMMPVDRQIPIITVTSSSNSPTCLDEITLKAVFKEDVESGSMKINNANLQFLDGSSNIGSQHTDENGEASVKYKCNFAGQRTFEVRYNPTSSNRYQNGDTRIPDQSKRLPIEGTLTINVAKIATRFINENGTSVELQGSTSQEITMKLIDAKENLLLSKEVKVVYNNTTKIYKTNGAVEIKVDTGGKGELNKGTVKHMIFKYEGDANHKPAQDVDLEIKWGEYPDNENCDDLNAFDIMTENYYASDGSAKWGIDPNETREAGHTVYKNNTTSIHGTGVLLRTICTDLHTEGYIDEEEVSITAPTGVIMRSKKITTTSKCTITFTFIIKYNEANKKVAPHLFGGHFGLMEDGSNGINDMLCENAPVRFEFYRKNSYVVLKNQDVVPATWRYAIEANKEYNVVMEINGKNIKVQIYDIEMNKLVKTPFECTNRQPLVDLHPYCFSFTNGTAFVMKNIKITRED